MATPIIESAWVTGEVSPALFGQVSLARMHSAAATCRNFFVSFQGGAYSRAGTAFVGFSKQTGRGYPPRLITFQFSINQGLALEFGNFYMRVVFDGAYVTEPNPFIITNVSRGFPAVLSLQSIGNASSVSAGGGSITASYAPGNTVTLAGGTFTTAAVLLVQTTTLVSLLLNAAGTGYTPGDVITLLGGGQIQSPKVTVTTTKVVSATISSGGFFPVNGTVVLTGTSGAGSRFQASCTVSGNTVTSINSITFAGVYSSNPNQPETMSGGGAFMAPIFNIVMGINSALTTVPGVFSANAAGGNFTQASTTGTGTGATFHSAIFGPSSLSINVAGVYSAVPTSPVGQSSTSGSGVGALFNVVWNQPGTIQTGDWLFLSGIQGVSQLNGRTVVAAGAGPNFVIADVYGNLIDSSLLGVYLGGGTAARIYTLPTQYAEQDLKWLKFTQSADVMSLCCVNQQTGTEYPAVDLSRNSDTNWTFTPAVPAPSVTPPTAVSLTATPQPPSPTTQATYQYEVTAVSPIDGTESIASPIGSIANQVDIAATIGTITVTWNAVANVNQYNVYKAFPGVTAISASAPPPPAGALFGFIGSAYGTQFIDTNIIPDDTQVPPLHINPFARGKILAVVPSAQGSGYTHATASITTTQGSGAVIIPIIVGGAVVGYIVEDSGSGFQPSDSVAITGDGTGATANLTIGPQTGTYPAVVAYFQERRAYAYTLNQPDTAFLSQPGAFTNFDIRIPTIDSDAIQSTPWAVEVNGIQFMLPVTGGLMVLTGLEAYFLAGAGSSPFTPTPLTPSSQSALPQGFNGCSPTIPPIRIYQDVIYVQAKGSTYRDFSFDISQYTYTGVDVTSNSTHLFRNFTILEHAWCEEPYRVLWAVRSDGILLSLTWDKHEKVSGWARHDTNGLFQSVCSVTEPPVDALYVAVQRYIGTNIAYTVERMDNRLWSSVEEAWCVDCGFSLPMGEPPATLTASSATGAGQLSGVTNLVGGNGYSANTTFMVTDAPTVSNGPLGPGTGAVAVGTIVGGVITAIGFTNQGANYLNPQIAAVDPAGSAGGGGFSASVILNNTMVFNTNAPVFQPSASVGYVIRMGGGVATITAFQNAFSVVANITTPIVATFDDDNNTVIPQPAGTWTISSPITNVAGLDALDGATVTGLADGVAIPPTVVVGGQITLPNPASQVTIGLGFQARLQSVYLDAGEPTAQGQRKKLAEVTARVEASGPFLIGSNQPDGSTLSPIQIAPPWRNLAPAPTPAVAAYNSKTVPLFTGDIRIPIQGGFQTPGQVAVQQDLPYPLQILAFVPTDLAGDTPSQAWPQQQRGRGR